MALRAQGRRPGQRESLGVAARTRSAYEAEDEQQLGGAQRHRRALGRNRRLHHWRLNGHAAFGVR